MVGQGALRPTEHIHIWKYRSVFAVNGLPHMLAPPTATSPRPPSPPLTPSPTNFCANSETSITASNSTGAPANSYKHQQRELHTPLPLRSTATNTGNSAHPLTCSTVARSSLPVCLDIFSPDFSLFLMSFRTDCDAPPPPAPPPPPPPSRDAMLSLLSNLLRSASPPPPPAAPAPPASPSSEV